uniref:TPX2 C-terminal domain-containing protein n=1 Tax=Mycena chlorophos TaxID=658473 RepID=A0ABQ0L0C9_MYCCL|nr:predicted protein [Mycena chlorophos]
MAAERSSNYKGLNIGHCVPPKHSSSLARPVASTNHTASRLLLYIYLSSAFRMSQTNLSIPSRPSTPKSTRSTESVAVPSTRTAIAASPRSRTPSAARSRYNSINKSSTSLASIPETKALPSESMPTTTMPTTMPMPILKPTTIPLPTSYYRDTSAPISRFSLAPPVPGRRLGKHKAKSSASLHGRYRIQDEDNSPPVPAMPAKHSDRDESQEPEEEQELDEQTLRLRNYLEEKTLEFVGMHHSRSRTPSRTTDEAASMMSFPAVKVTIELVKPEPKPKVNEEKKEKREKERKERKEKKAEEKKEDKEKDDAKKDNVQEGDPTKMPSSRHRRKVQPEERYAMFLGDQVPAEEPRAKTMRRNAQRPINIGHNPYYLAAKKAAASSASLYMPTETPLVYRKDRWDIIRREQEEEARAAAALLKPPSLYKRVFGKILKS